MEVKLYGDNYVLEFDNGFKRWLFTKLFRLRVIHISELGECAWIEISPREVEDGKASS